MEPNRRSPAGRSRRWLGRTLDHALVWLLLFTVIGLLGRFWWIFELFSHFRPHAAAGLTLLTLIFLWRRLWGRTALSLAGLVANVVSVLPLWTAPVPQVDDDQPSIRMITFNVNTANDRYDDVLSYLGSSGADLILVLEVDQRWATALDALTESYRVVTAPSPDNFGLALLSRLPVEHIGVISLIDGGPASIEAIIEWNGAELALLGTHTLPPVSADYAARRDEQLEAVAAWSQRQGMPVVVLGDLNATPWSGPMRRLVERSDLLDSSAGRGWQPTWPAQLGLLGIPIDHCLHSRDLAVAARRTGPSLGSDHRAVELVLARAVSSPEGAR